MCKLNRDKIYALLIDVVSMNKNLKNVLRTAKKAKKMGLVYFDDSINPVVEPKYQLLASVNENMNPMILASEYEELKDDKDALLWELALSTFAEDSLVTAEEINFRADLIEKYFDLKPVPIEDQYTFTVIGSKLYELYEKALQQIHEGKSKNVMFK